VVQKGIPKPNDLPGQDAKIRRVAIHTLLNNKNCSKNLSPMKAIKIVVFLVIEKGLLNLLSTVHALAMRMNTKRFFATESHEMTRKIFFVSIKHKWDSL
jgi:hypothetical protein